uniref:NADH-ubiquinone oxidoreductase chain 6 n=1 Tax=Sphaeroderma testaceum TaxID=428710 RepID=A0A3G1GQQ0_9CUCU|nr:NADH dehydrogenase subunit 6 [Sphaeroderma testaceum]
MIMPMMIFCSSMFIFVNHPLSCGVILLIQTILIALMSGLMNYHFWYSYILFLIMIGGMLILFIYMTSIASNEKFKFSNKLLFMALLTFIMIITLLFMDKIYLNMFNKLENLTMININNSMSMIKYFNFPNYYISLMMIIYLFLTLIAVVKITKFSYGSLRQKF